MANPQCKAHTRKGERCLQPAADGFEVCRYHGASAAKARLKPGNLTTVQKREIRTFVEALGDRDEEFIEAALSALMAHLKDGNLAAAQDLLDRRFGKALNKEQTEHSGRIRVVFGDDDPSAKSPSGPGAG